MDTAPSPNWEDLRAPHRPQILGVLAWVSIVSLVVCWGSFATAFLGGHIPAPNYVLPISFLSAFVLGISSCEPMGGIVAGLATLSFVALLFYASGGASC